MKLLSNDKVLDEMGSGLKGQDLCDQLLCRVSEKHASRCSNPDDNAEGSDGSSLSEEESGNGKSEESLFMEGYGALAGFSDSVIEDQSSHPFPLACVFSKRVHRVLIVPNVGQPEMPYGLFSCLTNIDPLCTFERRNQDD